MTRFTIDAPTLLHLVEGALSVDAKHQLVAPSSIRSEALTTLLRDVRAGRRTEPEARQLHTRMTEVKIRVLGDRMSRWTAWKIAQEHDWDNLRDAEYLAVTKLQADALVTVDPVLAAKADGVVPIAPLENLTR
ncbi:type II toxin-antitoxin system VapC family toxin [Kribbella sp. NPDC058245]|uniref:type II toxin-antitoxin system VapC family toxin n=1 Tax=Kribbella sp. NPDC058245 TaxID=3346399 RepID=UPI0036E167A2